MISLQLIQTIFEMLLLTPETFTEDPKECFFNSENKKKLDFEHFYHENKENEFFFNTLIELIAKNIFNSENKEDYNKSIFRLLYRILENTSEVISDEKIGEENDVFREKFLESI